MATTILLASNNRHKLDEVRRILGADFRVLSPQDVGMSQQVEETGSTFEENARLKAEAGRDASGLITIADDSGLEVDALGGDPGIYSARYGGPERSDRERIELVLEQMDGIPDSERNARFVAAVAVADVNGQVDVVRGVVEGRIATMPHGENGFGYDPIFFFPPLGKTFGELDPRQKSRISHRALALSRARRLLERRYTDRDSVETEGR